MSPASRSIRARACAKVNLTLRVLGIHPDGYHELRTTFQSLALHDTLTFTAGRGPFRISSTSPDCPVDDTNLVWKAAAHLWRVSGRAGEPHGVHVHIRKRVPVQAGLGGGSSDAAAALRALPLLWRMRVDRRDLGAIGRSLGADVSFFLDGGTALGVERGDLLFPLQDTPRTWVVLARPGFGVSTRAAYGWWDEAFLGGARPRPGKAEAGEWVNDLEAPVVRHHPQIGRLVRKLERAGARFAAMSGSGSAVFGLFEERAAAANAAAALTGHGVKTWVTRTLNRREYLRATTPIEI